MKNNKLFIAIFVLVCLIFSVILLCSCNTDKNEDPKTNVDERLDNIDTNISQDNIDSSYNENTATVIIFSNNGVSIDGNGATYTGNDVSITKENHTSNNREQHSYSNVSRCAGKTRRHCNE